MKRTLVMIFLGLLLLPLCASAQVQVGGGVRAGLFGYNEDHLDGTKLFWGAHGRVRVLKFLGAEISYQTREDSLRLNQGDIKLKTTPIQLSGIVYPLGFFFISPYIVFGTGWYDFDITVTGDIGLPFVVGEGTISVSEKAPHIGIGVEAFFMDHFSVGADVRKVNVKIQNPIVQSLQIEGLELNAYMFNITGTFYF